MRILNLVMKPEKINVLIYHIWFNMNKDNMINKSKVANDSSLVMCNRTLNKYWKELLDSNLIVKTDKNKIYMVNPDYMRFAEISEVLLKSKWKRMNKLK